MFSSARSPHKTPVVNSHIKSLLETETPLLQKLNNIAVDFLSTSDPLYTYVEIPLKKHTYSFLDSDNSIKSPDNLVVLLWDATSLFTGENYL